MAFLNGVSKLPHSGIFCTIKVLVLFYAAHVRRVGGGYADHVIPPYLVI
jgi:hypothetical protein